MRVVPRAVAVVGIAVTAFAAGFVTGPASATPPTWGPDAVPYRAGVVCTAAADSSALVSWHSAATGRPAYALQPVTSDATRADRPAVDTVTTSALADSPAIAALLARHGDTKDPAEAAEVAAAVLGPRGLDPVAAHCLAAGTGGATAAGAAALLAEAARLAGPYSVRLEVAAGKLTLGTASAVTATVTAASGSPSPASPSGSPAAARTRA